MFTLKFYSSTPKIGHSFLTPQHTGHRFRVLLITLVTHSQVINLWINDKVREGGSLPFLMVFLFHGESNVFPMGHLWSDPRVWSFRDVTVTLWGHF